MPGPHSQDHARVRVEWGPVGAVHTLDAATTAVIVDVLSFTTTLSVAVDIGAEVYPYRWADDSAVEFARRHDATLAVGRLEAQRPGNVATVSLSPQSVQAAHGLSRLVLPSPNGSTISAQVAGAGADVLAASLRNRSAVARWLAERLATEPETAVTLVAAGERWPDGSLRPAVEDLWGAGAVVSALLSQGVTSMSPEAHTAAAAFDAVRSSIAQALSTCSSGRELTIAGFGADVAVAAEVDVSVGVPMLVDLRFIDAAAAGNH
ncbi:2-phosphosulfolactate phosphatase [Haloactinopolyspora sp.]|uniref:2-phosphosulfolactate phosphatase n=1 Tax=Haloactinopolyspora sp. TaxID=1966353 RepID=UPI002629244F|nr:2-phosphosulfolactate phosphatase [Haloactinopolyspora sp.]